MWISIEMRKIKIYSLLVIVLLNIQVFSQIKIIGVKKSSIVETNKEKSEVKQINEINFTKTKEEKIHPKYVQVGNIEEAKILSKENAVEVNLYNSKNSLDLKDGETRKISIDLDNAKEILGSNTSNKEQLVLDTKTHKNLIIEEEKIPTTEVISSTKNINSPEIKSVTQESKPVISKLNTKEDNIPISESNINEIQTEITESNKTSSVVGEPIKSEFLEPKLEKLNEVETPKEIISTNISSSEPFVEKEASPIKIENIESDIKVENNAEIFESKTENLNEIEFEKESISSNVSKLEVVKEVEIEKTEIQEIEEPAIQFGKKEKLIVKTEEQIEGTKIEKNKSDNNKTDNNKTDNLKIQNTNPKKGSWSIGLGFGVPIIIGDMDSKFGYGASLNIQKALGHVFSLRFQAIVLETFGLDHKKYFNKHANYKTRFSDYTVQGIVTLNNLNFYKKEPKVIYNLIAGAGLATRHSWVNNFDDSGNLYTYDAIPTGNKAETFKALNSLLDKNYETIIAKDETQMSIKNTNIVPSVVLGLGVAFKVSKTIDINLESRFSYHFSDNLDAHIRGKNNDWLSFTTLGFTFKFPSKNESMLWTNPVYSNVEEIQDLKKKVDAGNLLKDEDKDGIADIFDQDLNTPEKVAVDSRGIPSDMDKDGVPDYKDLQPFTTIGAQVDANGVALDSDNDGIPDILDQEENTLAGNLVDANGRTIKQANTTTLANIKGNSDFDLIFFDENSYRVKKEFYSDLYKISRYIDANPSAQIQITGYTDVLATEEFNMNLSEKRANAVYSMLIELFKVPSNNLITNFYGEKNPLIKGLPEQKDFKFAAAYYINRRVEFKILK